MTQIKMSPVNPERILLNCSLRITLNNLTHQGQASYHAKMKYSIILYLSLLISLLFSNDMCAQEQEQNTLLKEARTALQKYQQNEDIYVELQHKYDALLNENVQSTSDVPKLRKKINRLKEQERRYISLLRFKYHEITELAPYSTIHKQAYPFIQPYSDKMTAFSKSGLINKLSESDLSETEAIRVAYYKKLLDVMSSDIAASRRIIFHQTTYNNKVHNILKIGELFNIYQFDPVDYPYQKKSKYLMIPATFGHYKSKAYFIDKKHNRYYDSVFTHFLSGKTLDTLDSDLRIPYMPDPNDYDTSGP